MQWQLSFQPSTTMQLSQPLAACATFDLVALHEDLEFFLGWGARGNVSKTLNQEGYKLILNVSDTHWFYVRRFLVETSCIAYSVTFVISSGCLSQRHLSPAPNFDAASHERKIKCSL
eukprot:2113397-Amphidinium_carterae.1